MQLVDNIEDILLYCFFQFISSLFITNTTNFEHGNVSIIN